MKKLSRTLLITVLTVCLFISSIAMQLSICSQRTFFNDQFYKSFAEKNNLYSTTQDYVLLTIKNKIGLDEETYKSLTTAAKTAFPEEWTEKQFSIIINNLLGYIKGDYNELNLKIDFTQQKSKFTDELVSNIKPRLLDVNILSEDYKLYMAEYLSKSSGIPDYVDLISISELNNIQLFRYTNLVKASYPYVATLPYLLFAVLLVLMIICFKPAQALKNTGYILVASGMTLIIFASYASGVLDHNITSHLTIYDELQALIGSRPKLLIAMFKNSVLSASQKIAISFCISGLIAYLAGYLFHRQQHSRYRSFGGF